MTAWQNLTVPSAGLVVLGTDNGDIPCIKIGIGCSPDSTVPMLVNIEGLHNDGQWFPMSPGAYQEFSSHGGNIRTVTLKGDGGDAISDGGIVEVQ